MRHSFSVIIVSAAFANAQGAWQVGQTVKTTSGSITGQASSLKNQVSEYLGVPFALPPVGDLRWAAPQPIKDDSKTINATKYVSDMWLARIWANITRDCETSVAFIASFLTKILVHARSQHPVPVAATQMPPKTSVLLRTK
jgi:hypothetical protein